MKVIKKTAQKPKYNLFAVVVLLMALIVVGLGRIDWETARSYKNKEGDYSIRFPVRASLYVNKVKVEGVNKYNPVKNVIELDIPGKPKPYILISHFNNVGYESVSEYAENTSECEAIEEFPGEEIMIGGETALLYKNVQCNTDGETRIYIIKDDMGYSITFNEKEIDEKYLNLVIDNLNFN